MMTLHRHRHRYSPANHCTPLLTLFRDLEDPDIVLAVMPFLRTTPKDTFQYVGDVAEFVGQVLLGIGHMHSRHIAHRDCSFHNILTDLGVEHLQYLHQRAVANYSLGKLIPLNHDYNSEFCEAPSPDTIATITKRPKYFIHDTTFSQHGDPEMIRISQGSGVFSRDLRAPEYREYRQSYNPFDLDIFLVGNMLRNEFLNKYSNLEFLRDLVAMMTHEVPRLRPKASECLAEWCSMAQWLSWSTREQPLLPRGRDNCKPQYPSRWWEYFSLANCCRRR
ncbi:hypothetical protein BC629DRAFT_1287265 [Irpex lacteus]|nr:hypothetical protein BC629DRAFT_1287265 [Irpex lacteus]